MCPGEHAGPGQDITNVLGAERWRSMRTNNAVWVIEYLRDGEWVPFNVFLHMDAATQCLIGRRKEGDPKMWRRKMYVRDTSTKTRKGLNR